MTRADADIELDDAYFAHPGPDAALWGEAHFIPSDPAAVAMQALMADPGSYFLPLVDAPQGAGGGKMLYAGPMGLSSELQDLFTFPVNVLRRDRDQDQAEADGDRAAKRPRVEGQPEAAPEEEELRGEEADIELARRQSTLPPTFHQGEGEMDDSFNFGADPLGGDIDDPLAFDLPQTPRKAPAAAAAERYPSLAPSRAESMARLVQYAGEGGEFTLAMFDNRTTAGSGESQSQSQAPSTQQTPTKSSVAASEARTHGGYSKNTGMAMGLLRRELEVIEAEVEQEREEKVVKMNQLADKVSSVPAHYYRWWSAACGDTASHKSRGFVYEIPVEFFNGPWLALDRLWNGRCISTDI